MRVPLLAAVLGLAGCAAPEPPAAPAIAPADPLPVCDARELGSGTEGDLAQGDLHLLTFIVAAPARVAASLYATHGAPEVAVVAGASCEDDLRTVPAERETDGRTVRLDAALPAGAYAFAVRCAAVGSFVCGYALSAHLDGEARG